MRYADTPSVEVDILIDAPLADVWRAVTDIDLPASYSPELLGATWLDDAPGLGARFVGRNRHEALGEWETTSFVTRYEPLRAFEWAVTDPEQPSATWWFELDATDDGVRLRQGGRMGPARSGLSFAIDAMPEKEERIVARRLEEWERNMRATLEGIKARLEGGS